MLKCHLILVKGICSTIMASSRNMYVQLIEDEFEEGDIIEIVRAYGVYTHHCIYVGNGEVIHLGLDRKDNPKDLQSWISAPGRSEIRINRLTDVVKTSPVVVNNKYDNIIQPLAKPEIVRRAYTRLGEKSFNLLYHNCEHFATECRYGKRLSGQVEKFADVGKLVVDTGLELIQGRGLSAGIKERFLRLFVENHC